MTVATKLAASIVTVMKRAMKTIFSIVQVSGGNEVPLHSPWLRRSSYSPRITRGYTESINAVILRWQQSSLLNSMTRSIMLKYQ